MERTIKIVHREAELQRRYFHWHKRLISNWFVRFIGAAWYCVAMLDGEHGKDIMGVSL